MVKIQKDTKREFLRKIQLVVENIRHFLLIIDLHCVSTIKACPTIYLMKQISHNESESVGVPVKITVSLLNQR